MTATTFTLNFDNTSDATFRAWATIIHNQLAALGWVQTADTGQINLTTATRSATAGQNYEIWRTNDGGSVNLYAKVEYVNQVGTTAAGLALTVAEATDGAGNLVGAHKSARFGLASNASMANDTLPRTCFVSGGAGRFAFALNVDAPNTGNTLAFGVERPKDAAGADVTTGGYLLAFLVGGNVNLGINGGGAGQAGFAQFCDPTNGPAAADYGGLSCLISNANSNTGLYSGSVPVGLWVPCAGQAQNPGMNWACALTADVFPLANSGPIGVYGANHTFIGLGGNINAPVCHAKTQVPNTRLMMRYE